MMEQSDVKSMRRQSSFDPNNNRVADDPGEPVDDDQLVEAINVRLREITDANDHNRLKSDSQEDDSSVISDGDFDALDEPVEDGEEGVSDGGGDDIKKAADDEPYDVDKALISTFLEHTTSIVRRPSPIKLLSLSLFLLSATPLGVCSLSSHSETNCQYSFRQLRGVRRRPDWQLGGRRGQRRVISG